MWFRLMILAFLFNGVCTFGLRILAGMGCRHRNTELPVLLVCGRRSRCAASRTSRIRTCITGGCLCRRRPWSGQAPRGRRASALALSRGLPGNIVFPVTLAGGLFIVVAAGILIFKEHVGKAGLAGIGLGILSIALLSL